MNEGLSSGVFPGGIVLWGTGERILGEVAAGHCRLTPPPPFPPVTSSTLFDLASLTKPLVTGALVLLMISEGRFSLETPLSGLLSESLNSEAGKSTVRELLAHSSGLVAWAPLYEKILKKDPEEAKKDLLALILDLPLAYERGTRVLYSDFGFILLGFALERAAGRPLENLYRTRLAGPLAVSEADYLTGDSGLWKREHEGSCQIASTEVDSVTGLPLTGVVHDEHARLTGRVSGHAGLFGTARAVWQLSRIWMEGDFLPKAWREKFRRRQEPFEWALGWDTPTPGSSSGHLLTPDGSIGHLGYAGTSVWMDWKKDRIIVLLTNRVHPVRTNNLIRDFRPVLHDRVVEAAFSS
jgi:CubicO group peptidase (beta-lactamase class C family)